MLNWGLMSQQTINLPNFASLNGPTILEEKRFAPATVEALKARGHEVREINMTSGLQAIVRGQAHGQPLWLRGADPRREGVVTGDWQQKLPFAPIRRRGQLFLIAIAA